MKKLDELTVMEKEEQKSLISRICLFDKNSERILKGKLSTAHDFEERLKSAPIENKKIQKTILDIVIDEEKNWTIRDVKYSIYCSGSAAANFYLTWPKGDGFRHQIIDLAKVSEKEAMGNIEALQTLSYSSFVYGSFQAAYKTQDGAIIIAFYYRE